MLILSIVLVMSESPNYVISMNVRSMNEIEDCPTVLLNITYPDGYPNESLQIEFDDDEAEEFEAEHLEDLTSTLNDVVSFLSLVLLFLISKLFLFRIYFP